MDCLIEQTHHDIQAKEGTDVSLGAIYMYIHRIYVHVRSYTLPPIVELSREGTVVRVFVSHQPKPFSESSLLLALALLWGVFPDSSVSLPPQTPLHVCLIFSLILLEESPWDVPLQLPIYFYSILILFIYMYVHTDRCYQICLHYEIMFNFFFSFLCTYSYATQIHCLLSKRWDVVLGNFLTPVIITWVTQSVQIC